MLDKYNFNNIYYLIRATHNFNFIKLFYCKKKYTRTRKTFSIRMRIRPQKILTTSFFSSVLFNRSGIFNFWCRNYSNYPPASYSYINKLSPHSNSINILHLNSFNGTSTWMEPRSLRLKIILYINKIKDCS